MQTIDCTCNDVEIYRKKNNILAWQYSHKLFSISLNIYIIL